MRILVTGGAGFIASHIVDELIEIGHEVTIIDNLSTGSISNINSKAIFINTNILNKEIDYIFTDQKPEVVIHHAAQVSVQESLKNTLYDCENNIAGTVSILEQCRKSSVKKIIYSSSAAVYGTPQYIPIDEKHQTNPTSFYGISKYTPEHYFRLFSSLYDIDYTILRYANVYGPRQDCQGEGGVISIFIRKLLDNESPVVYGNGEQTRDFIYVKDVVSANIAAIHNGKNMTANIGNNRSVTINQLLLELSSIAHINLQPIYAESRPGDIIHSSLDNTIATSKLSWMPVHNFRDGLKETFDYYVKNSN
jgi:UDP-glucose 4-epimerase